MTKEVVVRLRDDLDKKLGATVQTRTYTIDGVVYESELSDANYKSFLKATEAFRAVAREVRKTPKKKTRKPPQTESAKIRGWARDVGLMVPPRGSVPPDIVAQYHESHPPEAQSG